MSRAPRIALTLVAALVSVAAASDDAIRLAAVVTEGVPRGLVTVVVPIPVQLRDEPEVSFEVRLAGGVEVLGRLRGPARVAGAPARPLVLTLRVPASADAGVINAAEVVFRAGDGREYIVPLRLRVSVVRAVTILGTPEMRGLRAGDRLELPFRIVNGGNSTDTVHVVVHAPVGWVARLDRPATVVIAPRGQLEIALNIGVPTSANLGDHALSLSLRSPAGGPPTATTYTTLGVVGRAGETTGLVLRPTIAVAHSSEGSATFSGVELDGPIATDMTIRARFSPALTGGGITMQGLSSVGASGAPFAASLSGKDWDLSAGNTALQLSDLTGVNLVGRGVTGRLETADRELRAIGARPSTGSMVQGELFGAGYWQRTRVGRVGGSASYLAEQGGYSRGRDLTAFAADYRSHPLGTVTLGAALAHRSSAAADGLGYSASLLHQRQGERLAMRMTHAPGGSAAYARAVDEWQMEASRVLTTNWTVDGAAQHSRDAGAVFSRMNVTSWSLGQRYAFSRSAAFSLRGQSSSFAARTADGGFGGFGSADREIVGAVEWRRNLLALATEGSLGRVSRSTELLGGRVSESRAAQRGVRVTATQGLEGWGALDAHASLDATEAGVGLPSQMLSAGLRWSELPVAIGTRQARLGIESSFQRLGDLRTAVVARATMRAALPAGLDLVMSAERNPFFRDSRGRPGWIAAMRLTASTRVFSVAASGPEGVVYQDLDQDGARGENEPGVPGVVVRRGDARATTDRMGRYRLPLNARGRTRIDQGTLPSGLLAHPLLAADSLERLDLPVLPTGTVVIELALEADESGRVPDVDLSVAVVMLRDASGFEWVGRRAGGTTALFEGVPTGSYTAVFDFTQLREAVRVRGETSVTVRAHRTQTVRVAVLGRALRIFTPSGRTPSPAPRGPGMP